MKNLPTYNEFINEQEEAVNEDASSLATSIMLLMQSTALLAVAMAKSGAFDTYGSDQSLKGWWESWKRDRKVNKILDRLQKDPEIIEFLALPANQQKGKWQKLVSTKLNKDEIEYLNSVSRDRVKKGKI